MKTIKVMMLVLFSFCFIGMWEISFSQEADWVWKNPRPTSSSIRFVHFVSPDTGFFSGADNARLLRTTDGGGFISELQLDASVNRCIGLHFFTADTALFISYSGKIMKGFLTVDGDSIPTKMPK